MGHQIVFYSVLWVAKYKMLRTTELNFYTDMKLALAHILTTKNRVDNHKSRQKLESTKIKVDKN